MPDTATRTSLTCYSSLLSINGNAYFENLVDYSLPNDFSRSPTLGGKKYLTAEPLLAPSYWLLFTKIINTHAFPQPLSGLLVYLAGFAHPYSQVLTTLKQYPTLFRLPRNAPSHHARWLHWGVNVYIFYYALVNEHTYYNINFLFFQDQAVNKNCTYILPRSGAYFTIKLSQHICKYIHTTHFYNWLRGFLYQHHTTSIRNFNKTRASS